MKILIGGASSKFFHLKEFGEMLKKQGFYVNQTFRDYGNNDRCIISTKI